MQKRLYFETILKIGNFRCAAGLKLSSRRLYVFMSAAPNHRSRYDEERTSLETEAMPALRPF